MTPKQILDSFSETLMQDDRILSSQERALLANLLQHAKASSQKDPQIDTAVRSTIAAAVGETVAQRAFAILGSSIVDRILAPAVPGVEKGPTVYASPGPLPPSPQPPGPKGTPAPPSTPVRESPTRNPPLTPSPEPPGTHGLFPTHEKLQATESAQGTGTLVISAQATRPANCLVLDEFLSPHEMEELTLYALQCEADFETSEVITPTAGGVIDFEHRRSRVLTDLGKHESIVVSRVNSVLPSVLKQLGMAAFPVSAVEAQITASNDGDFFRIHPDDGQTEVANRRLTFVYFFHREPRAFDGGELRLHDATLREGRWVTTGRFQSIVPLQNQIVFFPCSVLHEITPVVCPSRAFADSRFTLNGWLRQ